jgi:hypothetical protein
VNAHGIEAHSQQSHVQEEEALLGLDLGGVAVDDQAGGLAIEVNWQFFGDGDEFEGYFGIAGVAFSLLEGDVEVIEDASALDDEAAGLSSFLSKWHSKIF